MTGTFENSESIEADIGLKKGSPTVHIKGTGRAVNALVNVSIVLFFICYLEYKDRGDVVLREQISKTQQIRIDTCHDTSMSLGDSSDRVSEALGHQAIEFRSLTDVMRELSVQANSNGKTLNELLILERASHNNRGNRQ